MHQNDSVWNQVEKRKLLVLVLPKMGPNFVSPVPHTLEMRNHPEKINGKFSSEQNGRFLRKFVTYRSTQIFFSFFLHGTIGGLWIWGGVMFRQENPTPEGLYILGG